MILCKPHMYKVGGYVLTTEDAVAWAKRRWDDIDVYDERVIAGIIRIHNKEKGGPKFNVIPFYEGRLQKTVCMFVVYAEHDPLATYESWVNFPEDGYARNCRDFLFPFPEDAAKATYGLGNLDMSIISDSKRL
ncbi:hypothetical protein H0H93_004090, partial [Arthromyces matolae]